MGGLRLLISGGEPLLYEDLEAFLAETAGLKLRRVLLSNGTLITPRNMGLAQSRGDPVQPRRLGPGGTMRSGGPVPSSAP